MCLFASHTSPLSAETPHQITPQVAGSCLRDSHPLFCLNARILLTTHQADAETLAIAKCRPGSVFGTVETANVDWRRDKGVHLRSSSIGSTNASATCGDKHGEDPSHEKLAPRSTTIMEKVSCGCHDSPRGLPIVPPSIVTFKHVRYGFRRSPPNRLFTKHPRQNHAVE
jgi:hypothetical protein